MSAKAPPPPRVYIPSWERCLPCKYTVASTPSATSLSLEVELETMDMQCTQQVQALLDSGATGLFMDVMFVEKHQLTTCPLTQPIPVYNIDGTPNEAGSIRCVTECILCYYNHVE